MFPSEPVYLPSFEVKLLALRRNAIGSVVFVCMCVAILPASVLSNVLFVDHVKS